MIISFSNIPFVLACVVGAVIIATHLAPLFLRCGAARWMTYLGVVLHPVFIVLMFFAGAEFDLLVALILASVLIYTLSRYLSYLTEKKRGTKE